MLHVHWRQRQDLRPLLASKLLAHDSCSDNLAIGGGFKGRSAPGLTVHSCSDRIPCLVHQHTGVVTKSNNSPICPLQFLLYPDYHGMSNITTTDLVGERRAAGPLGASSSLLLYDDNYTIT